jgi:hypothetical protein
MTAGDVTVLSGVFSIAFLMVLLSFGFANMKVKHTHADMHTQVHMLTYLPIHAIMNTYARMHTYVCMHPLKNTYVHNHMNTHERTRSSPLLIHMYSNYPTYNR